MSKSHSPENGHDLDMVERGSVTNDNAPAEESNVVEFDGPGDAENPLNWAPTKKFVTIAIVSFLTFLS